MAAPRTPLPDLPKGYRFPDTTFELTAEHVEGYLAAVEDANGLYLEQGLAPPLAVAGALYLGVVVVAPLLRLLPGDIIVHFYQKR